MANARTCQRAAPDGAPKMVVPTPSETGQLCIKCIHLLYFRVGSKSSCVCKHIHALFLHCPAYLKPACCTSCIS
jgi:hypothetical protein